MRISDWNSDVCSSDLLLLLAERGFGLALDRCTATGATADLAFVSPKSGAAVCRATGAGYADRLFALPPFLASGGAADWADILAGLAITGHFLERDLFELGRASCRERVCHAV